MPICGGASPIRPHIWAEAGVAENTLRSAFVQSPVTMIDRDKMDSGARQSRKVLVLGGAIPDFVFGLIGIGVAFAVQEAIQNIVEKCGFPWEGSFFDWMRAAGPGLRLIFLMLGFYIIHGGAAIARLEWERHRCVVDPNCGTSEWQIRLLENSPAVAILIIAILGWMFVGEAYAHGICYANECGMPAFLFLFALPLFVLTVRDWWKLARLWTQMPLNLSSMNEYVKEMAPYSPHLFSVWHIMLNIYFCLLFW